MENASKALIIAGAILLSILLISLGIMVFNQAQDSIGKGGMSKAQVSTFNSNFTKYEGTKTGSDVKSLIQEVNASNIQDKEDNTGREIKLVAAGTGFTLANGSSTSGATTYKTSGVASAGKYGVEVTQTDSSGYISEITITKK